MLSIQNLSIRYYMKDILHEVSFDLHPGEIVGLLGENGAGKSSLMKTIIGYQKAYDGTVRLDGEKINAKNIERISFATSEHSFFAGMTAQEHMDFYKMQFPKFNETRFTSLMKFFKLSWGMKLKSFSTGQKNQFEVILALSQGADYIFLDEPFTGSDLFNREDFYMVLLGIVREDECIIISTHMIEEVKNVISRVLLLQNHTLVEDIKTEQLEEAGESLMEHLYQVYRPNDNRIAEVIQANQEEL